MKNKSKLLLTVLSFLSVIPLAGCGTNNHYQENGGSHIYIDDSNVATTGYEDVRVSDPEYFKGVHDFKYTKTSKPFIKQGKTAYKVVVPNNISKEEGVAKEELLHFFKIATNIDLEVITDENLTYNPNDKYISIGETTLLESSGIEIDYLYLTKDGTRIVTKGNSIFLFGGSNVGSLNAVYDFLHIYFRYEQYTVDIYEIDRNVKNLVLYNFDVTNIPDIQQRAQNYGFLRNGSGNYDQSNIGYRLRIHKGRGHYFMSAYKEFSYHSESKKSTNTNTYVPFDLHSAEHPKWFSDLCEAGEYQICYTAHGDPEELEALIDLVYRKVIFSMQYYTPEKYPDLNVLTFTMEDNFNICNCEACTAEKVKYGADSAVLIKFVNEVARRVDKWQKLPENAEYYREDFQLIYFAYNGYTDAPVIYDEKTNTYTPSHPDMVLEPNTGVYLAIIDRGDFQFSFFDNPIRDSGYNGNMGIKETIESWGALTDDIYLWLYQTNFGSYAYFFDSFSHYTQPMYNFISSQGLRMFFAQGQDTNASGFSGTNFNALKAYLNAKLSWDSTLDQATLMNRFFKAVYGRAEKIMWKYYTALRSFNYDMLMKNPPLVNSRSIYNKVANRAYMPLASLKSLVAIIDEAQTYITRDYYSEEEYNLYKYHIEAEALFPLYAQLQLYGKIDLTIEDQKAIANRILQLVYAMRLEGMNSSESGGSPVMNLPQDFLE